MESGVQSGKWTANRRKSVVAAAWGMENGIQSSQWTANRRPVATAAGSRADNNSFQSGKWAANRKRTYWERVAATADGNVKRSS
jgi:hypothetical protein